MAFENIIFEIRENIAFIEMNKPETLNALNTETLNELNTIIDRIETDDMVKAVIITGTGRAFVAGADISEMKGLSTQAGRKMTILGQTVFNKIEKLNKPVIAAVNGFALGGGCELAMACDIRIASDKAKFGQPEVNLGIIPGFGGTQRLPRLVGRGKAKYLIFSGEIIDSEEAFRIGLVERAVPADELMDSAIVLAKTIMLKAPVAVRMSKLAIDRGLNVDLDSGIGYEAEAYTTAFDTDDRIEGMEAFLEKRESKFKNK